MLKAVLTNSLSQMSISDKEIIQVSCSVQSGTFILSVYELAFLFSSSRNTVSGLYTVYIYNIYIQYIVLLLLFYSFEGEIKNPLLCGITDSNLS